MRRLNKRSRKATNKYIIKMLLTGNNYSTTGKRYNTDPQNVKKILYRELGSILLKEDWEQWLRPEQFVFEDLKLFQLQEQQKFILERVAQNGW